MPNVNDLFNTFVQPLAGCLDWFLESVLKPIFDNLVRYPFITGIIFAIAFSSLLLFFVGVFSGFINDFMHSSSSFGVSKGYEYKKYMEQEERRLQAEKRYNDRIAENEKKRKLREIENKAKKYPSAYLDGSTLAEKYFKKYPSRYTFSYAGQTYYNQQFFDDLDEPIRHRSYDLERAKERAKHIKFRYEDLEDKPRSYDIERAKERDKHKKIVYEDD